MKRFKLLIGVVIVMSLTIAPQAFAAKYKKFGVDQRHEAVQRELHTIKTSSKKFHWKMVMPWSKGLLFYDIAQHFADTVKLASGGRLDIKCLLRRRTGPRHADLRRRQQGRGPGRP